jgi:hypothetical protein
MIEAGDLSSDYPHYDPFLVKHPRRSRPGAHSKASRLGITKPRGRPWDVNEIYRLRMYRTATKEEILAAFPGRTWHAISTAARARGICRPKPAAAPTGIVVVDQILARANRRKLSLIDLDKLARTQGYFSGHKWRRKPDHAVHERAVVALGGGLRVRFLSSNGGDDASVR